MSCEIERLKSVFENDNTKNEFHNTMTLVDAMIQFQLQRYFNVLDCVQNDKYVLFSNYMENSVSVFETHSVCICLRACQ